MAEKENVESIQKTVEKAERDRKARKQVEEHANKALDKLKVEYAPIEKIKPNDYNPNRQSDHDFEMLCRSIEEDGFTQPIIVLDDYTIVDGEHRWRAGKTVGLKELPVVKVDMTKEQARVSTIRHNKARGSHNIQLEAHVIKELRDLGATDWMKDSLLMDDTDIHKMLDEIPEADIPDFTIKRDKNGKVDIKEQQRMSDEIRKIQDEKRKQHADEHRKAMANDQRFFKLNLIFDGDEGTVVKNALGSNPGEALLEFCKKEMQTA